MGRENDFDFGDVDRDDYSDNSGSYSRADEESGFVDFLTFRRMLVPLLIQIIFWLGVVGILVYAALQIKDAADDKEMRRMALIILATPLALLLWRVYCELVIVFFRMNETLTLIRNELRRQGRRR